MDPGDTPDGYRSIGFVAPLSSGEAVVAVPMLEAARRGAARAAGERGLRVAVVELDDEREPDRAAELVRRLAADPEVIGVVGPKNSGCARAAIPVARRAELPLLLPAATADDLCQLGEGWAFRLCATDSATATAAAALCRRLGVGRLAVIPDTTPYGIGLADGVRRAATAVGLEVTARLDGAGAAFHAMGEVEQAEAIRAARAAGFSGVLLGAEGGPGAALPALAGPAAEGAFQLYAGAPVAGPPAAGAPVAGPRAVGAPVLGATAVGAPVAGAPVAGSGTVYAAEAEDAARLLVEAAATAAGARGFASPPSRRAIRNALAATHLEGGASGLIAFTVEGERRHATVSVWRVRSGASVPAGPIDGRT